VFTAPYELDILTIFKLPPSRLSPRKTGFDARPVLVQCLVCTVALGQALLLTRSIFTCWITTPTVHTHVTLTLLLPERKAVDNWKHKKKALLLRKSECVG
jgi:hypothetical protein